CSAVSFAWPFDFMALDAASWVSEGSAVASITRVAPGNCWNRGGTPSSGGFLQAFVTLALNFLKTHRAISRAGSMFFTVTGALQSAAPPFPSARAVTE